MKQFFTLFAVVFLSISAWSQCQTLATSQGSTQCNPCNGITVCTAFGGTPPYTYVWAPTGGNQPTATGQCPGTYTITVTDAQGCVATATTTVTGMNTIFAVAQCTPALCNQLGSAMVVATGGTPPYTYNWSPSGQTSQTSTGLSPGCYTVVVTDAGGCTATASCCVTSMNAPTVSIQNVMNANCPNCNGSALAVVSGGTMPYVYQWSNAQTNSVATGLCQGTYTVLVTDGNGCTATATVTIGCITGVEEEMNNMGISVFPNPAQTTLHLSFANNLGEVSVGIYSVIGEKVLSSHINASSGITEAINISTLKPGIYFLEIKQGNMSLKKKFLKE